MPDTDGMPTEAEWLEGNIPLTFITCRNGNLCTVEPDGWCPECVADAEWEEMLADQEQYASCGHDHLEGHRCGEEADYSE